VKSPGNPSVKMCKNPVCFHAVFSVRVHVPRFVFPPQSADSVQLALELDGSKLDGRPVRVKRAERQKNNTDAARGPTKGPTKGPGGQERGGGWKGFKSKKKFSGNQQAATKSSNSFKGEMVDPNKKSQKKGQKKKKKPRTKRAVHI